MSVDSSLRQGFDGLHRRSMPKLYAALEPDVEDDRMKGALWTLNTTAFGARQLLLLHVLRIDIVFHVTRQRNTPLEVRLTIVLVSQRSHTVSTEPTLTTQFVRKLFACQHNEKVGSVLYCASHTLLRPCVITAIHSRMRICVVGHLYALFISSNGHALIKCPRSR